MAITFKYSRVHRKDGTLRRAPFIPLHLRDHSNRLLNFVALVDSGADTSVIPKNIATLLGLKESDHDENTAGIGGLVKVKTSRILFQSLESMKSITSTFQFLFSRTLMLMFLCFLVEADFSRALT